MSLTFAMIKPDAVLNKKVGEIISIIEENGFNIKTMQKRLLCSFEAQFLYKGHEGKSFYHKLIEFTSSGPVVLMVLEKDDCVNQWRKTMVDIRKKYSGKEPQENAVHGSDSDESAVYELGWFTWIDVRDIIANPLQSSEEDNTGANFIKGTIRIFP